MISAEVATDGGSNDVAIWNIDYVCFDGGPYDGTVDVCVNVGSCDVAIKNVIDAYVDDGSSNNAVHVVDACVDAAVDAVLDG